MKKILVLLVAIAPSILAIGQEKTTFSETTDAIKFQSNRAKALAMMEKSQPNFTLIDNNQVLDSVNVMLSGKTKRVAYEKLVFVSAKDQAMLQFIFVGDMLYGKNISFYFPTTQVKEAEEKFKGLNEWISNSNKAKMIASPGSDEVYFTDEKIAAGKLRNYPAKRIHYNVWEGVSGIVMDVPDLHQLSDVDNSKGIWVFVSVYNTFDVPISTKFKFPKLLPPYATVNELAGVNDEPKK